MTVYDCELCIQDLKEEIASYKEDIATLKKMIKTIDKIQNKIFSGECHLGESLDNLGRSFGGNKATINKNTIKELIKSSQKTVSQGWLLRNAIEANIRLLNGKIDDCNSSIRYYENEIDRIEEEERAAAAAAAAAAEAKAAEEAAAAAAPAASTSDTGATVSSAPTTTMS